jgi:nitroimidazol reductase NimA-like FMN-containing flavoprotein (pyridoxamine 5'-phosphate oxidase superfamily)
MRKREKQLSQAECEAVLNDNIIGTLSLVEGARPYAVQLEYLYYDGAIYMGTYLDGRKIECLNRNNRAVFTVFEDRHSRPEMMKRGIPCRSVMAEGYIETIDIKEFTSRDVTRSLRLLKFFIEDIGSWQCTRKVCTLAAGVDHKKIMREWADTADRAGPPQAE